MLQIKKILLPTDFSRCANQALAQALYLAEQYKAELHMLHATVLLDDDPNHPDHHFPNKEEIHQRMQKLAKDRMLANLAAQRVGDLKIKQVQRRGISVAPIILEYAREQDLDLIVMGTHGRRGLGHLFLGSVAEEVVRLAHCPVLTIRERKEERPVDQVKRILVPVDFSEHSRQALVYAKTLADFYGAHLQLVHVVEDAKYPAFYMAERFSYFDVAPAVATTAHKELIKFFQEAPGPEVIAEMHVLEGRAAPDLVKFAEQHASDLIVIATHGLTGLEHVVLGSVTEKVVRRAPCPVLTVKTFGKALI
jgi:nucleotide-binding universal stress UspA family protein